MSGKRPFDNNNNEPPQSHITPRPPPLKKRFITSFNQQPMTNTPAASSSASMPTMDTLVKANKPPSAFKTEDRELMNLFEIDSSFSRRDLLTHMRAAKAQYAIEKDKVKEIDDLTDRNESTVGFIRLQSHMLRDELIATSNAILDSWTASSSDHINSQNAEQILNEVQNIGTILTNQIKSWSTKMQHLKENPANNTQPMVEFMQSEITELQKSYNAVSQYILEVQKQHDAKEQQIDAVTNRVWASAKRLEETQEELENCIQDIASAEKRVDRSESTVVAEMIFGTGSKPEETSAPTTPARETGGGGGGTPTLNETATAAAPTTTPVDATQQQLEECRLLIEIRKREYADLERDMYRLQQEENRLLDQVDMMSEEKVFKSEYVYDLQSASEFYDSRSHYWEQKEKELRKTEARLKEERREMIDQHGAQKLSQEEDLAKIKNSLEFALNRIQGECHEKNSRLDKLVAEDNDAKEKKIKVVNDATELKQRINGLEEQIRNMRQVDGTLEKERSQDYLKLKRQIDLAHGMLDALGQKQSQGNISKHDNDTATVLKANLDKLSSHNRMGVLDQLVQQREKLTLIVDFFENTEQELDAQMDFYGRIYDDGNRLDQIAKLINARAQEKLEVASEIAKYPPHFIKHKKDIEELVEKNNTLKVKSNTQADRIGTWEGTVRNLEQSVTEKEALIKESQKELESLQLEVDDNSQEITELQTSLERNEAQLTELSKLTMEKTRMLDQEVALKQEVEDGYGDLQKKWDLIVQGENPASQQLVDEVEDLRARFKCSTCRTRPRKVILLSCYHTFCKECIKKQIETRQRRCPSCNFSFGASDVKDLNLYNRH